MAAYFRVMTGPLFVGLAGGILRVLSFANFRHFFRYATQAHESKLRDGYTDVDPAFSA